jgi:hypothetical protein
MQLPQQYGEKARSIDFEFEATSRAPIWQGNF